MAFREPFHEIATSSRTVSRRAALRGLGSVGIAAGLGGTATGLSAASWASTVDARQIEPNADTLTTWLLSSGDQFRPGAPPDHAAATTEIDELTAMAAQRDDESLERIAFWNAGAPSYR